MAHGVMDLTTRTLAKAMDGAVRRHRVAANNLANIETPGYTARHVSFQEALKAAVRAEQTGERPDALETVGVTVEDATDPAGPDGNNVSIEAEMMELGEASMRFKILTRMLHTKLEMVGRAINDGRS